MTSRPTPPDVPIQIYIRFDGESAEGLHCSIGTDGEDRAPPRTRAAMVAILQGIALTFAASGDIDSGEKAMTLADAVLKGGDNAGSIS